MQIRIAELIVLISVSILVAVILEINKLGMNIEKKIKKPNIVYISDALISALCGLSLSLIVMLVVKNNIIFWIIASILGTFMGKKSFKIICSIFLSFIKIFKQADIDKIINELDEVEDEDKKAIENKTNNNDGS